MFRPEIRYLKTWYKSVCDFKVFSRRHVGTPLFSGSMLSNVRMVYIWTCSEPTVEPWRMLQWWPELSSGIRWSSVQQIWKWKLPRAVAVMPTQRVGVNDHSCQNLLQDLGATKTGFSTLVTNSKSFITLRRAVSLLHVGKGARGVDGNFGSKRKESVRCASFEMFGPKRQHTVHISPYWGLRSNISELWNSRSTVSLAWDTVDVPINF